MLRRVHIPEPERRVVLFGAVERDADRAGVHLRPLVTVPPDDGEAQCFPIERDRPIHVGDPEPHLLDTPVHQPPAPSSLASTTTAPVVEGPPSHDCARAR